MLKWNDTIRRHVKALKIKGMGPLEMFYYMLLYSGRRFWINNCCIERSSHDFSLLL